MSGGPTRAAQAALLERLRPTLEPILRAERVPTDYVLQPGTRLRRAYGRCVWFPETQHAVISVRCTADDDRLRWRHTGAIVGTLLHEAAHLRYRSHGPRFWTLHRRLVDRAVAAGVYDPTDRDPAERGRGDEKLAASAARSVALAARAARLERMRANRLALQAWQAGATARIVPSVGGLAGAMVRVVGLGRSRLLIETSDRRRYRIAPSLLIPA